VPLLQTNFSDLSRPSSLRRMSGEVRLGIGLNCAPGGVSFRAGCRLAQSHPRHGPPREAPPGASSSTGPPASRSGIGTMLTLAFSHQAAGC